MLTSQIMATDYTIPKLYINKQNIDTNTIEV